MSEASSLGYLDFISTCDIMCYATMQNSLDKVASVLFLESVTIRADAAYKMH